MCCTLIVYHTSRASGWLALTSRALRWLAVQPCATHWWVVTSRRHVLHACFTRIGCQRHMLYADWLSSQVIHTDGLSRHVTSRASGVLHVDWLSSPALVVAWAQEWRAVGATAFARHAQRADVTGRSLVRPWDHQRDFGGAGCCNEPNRHTFVGRSTIINLD